MPQALGARLAAGRTAEVFAWSDGQVVKLYPAGEAGEAEREANIAAVVDSLGLPVPRCHGTVMVDGRPGVVFDRVDGEPLMGAFLADPARAAEVGQTLGRLHGALHSRNAPALPPLRARLINRIGRARPLSPHWRSSALEQLEQLPDDDALCHGDFHPYNVLLTPAGAVVIDWVDVTHGHPLADVARTLLLMRHAQLAETDPPGLNLPAARQTFESAYLAAYRAQRPAAASAADIEPWLPVLAAARLAEGQMPEQAHLLDLLAQAFGPAAA